MIKIFYKLVSLIFFLLILSNCSNQTPTKNANEQALPSLTTLPGRTVTISQHPSPSGTSPGTQSTNIHEPTNSPTPSLTPYPTFIKQNIPGQPVIPTAICPRENAELELYFDISLKNYKDELFDFPEIIQGAFYQGASIQQIALAFEQAIGTNNIVTSVDLTGDENPELLLKGLYSAKVWGCLQEEHKIILDYYFSDRKGGYTFQPIEDLNLNGIPEILISVSSPADNNDVIDILEWDGVQITSRILANHGINSPETSRLARALYWYEDSFFWRTTHTPIMNGPASISFIDLNGDHIKEIVLEDNGPTNFDLLSGYGPWRGKKAVFSWDGYHYLYTELAMNPPIYRFQALQEGDRFFLLGQYDYALTNYQTVITNEHLEWWSQDRKDYLFDEFFYRMNPDPSGEKPSAPIPDPDEYPYLEAYARYRIMLLHAVQDSTSQAEFALNTLQDKFPKGKVGYEFAEIASYFWIIYQETKSIEASCSAVKDYVKGNPIIFTYLGTSAHGFQSHYYLPEDICPFP
ncbi:MAG: hypothetical protein JEZ06_23020 [Anaerolineaceae bacterium]|nr:hypothetical protein [Anaerolineaceae bacterium]